MRTTRAKRAKRYFVGGLGLLVLGAAFLLFAPVQWGGSASYAVTEGSSMEPEMRAGDLAVLRERPSYGPGRVVGYRSHELGRVVLHRIVAVEGDRFVFKGDNNEWLDSERPSADDLLGELWLRAPKAGAVVATARQPVVAALLVGVVAVLALGLSGAGRHKRRGGNGVLRTLQESQIGRTIAASSVREAVVAGAALGLAVFFLLGAMAFARPATVPSQDKLAYEQRGSLAYSAPVPAGPVYQKEGVTTGNPVFLRLVSRLPIAYTYELTSKEEHSAFGTARLMVEITDPNSSGWKRTFDLRGAEPFQGDRVAMGGELNLPEVRSMISAAEAATGVSRDHYVLTVKGQVEVAGKVADRPFQESFSSPMSFQLDSLQLRPDSSGVTTAPGNATPAQTNSAQGSVQVPTKVANSLPLAVVRPPVPLVRGVALVGGLVCALALMAVAGLARTTSGDDEVAAIESAYGTQMVPVAAPPDGLAPAVRVPSMEVLARLADQYEALILHAAAGDVHSYTVDHRGRLYLYEVAVGGEMAPEEAAPAQAPKWAVRSALPGSRLDPRDGRSSTGHTRSHGPKR